MNTSLRNFFVFCFYFLVALLWYYPTAGAGFVTDQIGWFETYNTFGWKGVFTAFGDKSLHYVYHIFGYGFWRMFGFNGKAWMLAFVLLHAAVAIVSFHLFEKIFRNILPSKATIVSFTGSLLFLLSPYQTEPLVWYACVHYLVCSLLFLCAFAFFINYLARGATKYIIGFYILFIVSVFTLEISFSLPLILSAFILLIPLNRFAIQQKIKLLLLFVFPTLIVVAGYFLLSKLLRGSFAGHYGTSTHFNFDIRLLTENLLKYCAKIFTFSQFWQPAYRETFYLFVEKHSVLLFSIGALAAILVLFLHKCLSASLRMVLFLFAAFVLALSPVLNLFFYSITNVEGDRLSYLASVFGAQLAAFAVLVFLSHIGWLAVVVVLFFQLKFLAVNIESWQHNRLIRESLLKNFDYADAEKIFILNLPDNYNGTYMFRTFPPDNSFAETYKLIYGKDIESKMVQVLSYNMNSLTDSVTVQKISDNELKVTFAQWGNWWWMGGKGAGSYSTDAYSVTIDKWNHSYTIQLKEKTAGAVYLYQCGGEWKEVEGF